MIKIQCLTRKFGDKVAVDQISLDVARGEIIGLVGPNGAGKSTTVKMLTGLLKPTSGSALIAGFDVVDAAIEVKKRIGYAPESGALFESLSALEYLEMVAQLRHIDSDQARKRINEFLDLFGIADEKHTQLSLFSKGMKQKTMLAAAFLHNPEVLFLDEPLNGLDASAALTIKKLLTKLAGQGKTIIFCSHIMEVVEKICTRIVIIDHGKIIASGNPAEILAHANETTLENAFNRLTNSSDSETASSELLQALQQS